MASASHSVAQGGSGVPLALPPGPWYAPFPYVYGPLFFYLSAGFIHLFGLSAVTVRLVCVVGAALLAVTTVWLVRASGLDARWAAVGAAVMTLTPELGTIATNGRMDTLAIGLEVGAMSAAVAAMRAPQRRSAAAWGAASGILWLLALLTQVRTLPLLAGMGLAGLWLLCRRSTRSRTLVAGSCAVAVVLLGGLWWTDQMGVTPFEWAGTYLRSSRGDVQNVAIAGRPRVWGLELRNMMTPMAIAFAAAACAVIERRRRAAAAPAGGSAAQWPAAGVIPALVIPPLANVAFIFSVANNVFTSSSYFVLPLLAAVLTASALVGRCAGVERKMFAFWTAVAILFAGIRTVKYIEVWQTWAARDPAPLHHFIERFVPAGSLVFGYDQYYFYAVQAAGSTFRTWTPTPFPPPAFGKPAGISVEGSPSPAMADRRFLLWPVDGLPGPVPDRFACAIPHVVAHFSESDHEATGIERLGGFVPSLHGYPDTVLYQLPRDCHP
jgi:hypothetical protein